MKDAVQQIVSAIDGWRTDEAEPLVVAIDGHGAAGKTTIASRVSIARDATIVHMDQYLHELQDKRDPRPMAQYYDWERLRADALEPAIAWMRDVPDFGEGPPLILLEGVSSAAPALADLVERAVFVLTPEPLRLERLHERIPDDEWDEDWLAAERVYFESRPPESFDLVVFGYTADAYGPKISG